MLNGKNKIDKSLFSVNITALFCYFFVFQAPIDTDPTKWTLLISFALYSLSALLFIWFLHRAPIRERLFEELKKKTVKKHSKRIKAFAEDILVPFTRLKTREEMMAKMAMIESKKEHDVFIKSLENEIEELKTGKPAPTTPEEEKAIEYVIEGFLDQFVNAAKRDHNQAFHQPLDEKHAKPKLQADKLSFRFRRHVFISASVFAFFSIFIELLSK